ncbi:MAG: GAF domain-containing sensor histidine kinase [Anaerolineae bacterium]|nr:GAF domain-containing sensor histidine kinase [Anaerolineae bacterium]
MADSKADPHTHQHYLDIARQLRQGEFDIDSINSISTDELGQVLQELGRTLTIERRRQQQLAAIITHINTGLLLDEILDNVYDNFRDLIPYNRIGFSLLEDEGRSVRARWARTDRRDIKLDEGYSNELAGSSLEDIIRTGQPRILNDLEDYLRRKPDSESTQLIVAEGMRSSLTCPLIANGEPVGFMFFSSITPHIYESAHIDIFQRIAAELSVMVEKGRLVSELAEQKAAIEAQNSELRRLNDLKNTFLGIAAHDLRSPLSLIQTALIFLLDPNIALSDDERQGIMREVAQQSRYMLDLLDDLLDVTRIEAGKLELKPKAINLAMFLDETIARQARLAANKGTQVILVQPVPAGDVMADPVRLRQVIDNLVSNAVKYSPPGSTVRVGVKQTTFGWRISVQDEGPGIDPNDRERLFQDFARLSARPTGGEKSTGLGLAITRRVVEAHGGQIDVDSEPGSGATFWFTLPA